MIARIRGKWAAAGVVESEEEARLILRAIHGKGNIRYYIILYIILRIIDDAWLMAKS